MDEFKPEDDLRPDSSDRPSSRSRKAAPGPRFAVSRQHLMIGIGILVLLLLIIGIGSALKAPTKHESAQQQGSQSGSARDINLSGSSSLTTTNNGVPGGTTDANDANGVNTTQPQQPQEISVPPISGTPTEAQPQPQQGGAQQRVDLPGNMNDALSAQQGQVDAATQGMTGSSSTLPTAPATVMGGANAPRETTRPVQSHSAQPHKTPAKSTSKPAAATHKASSSKTSASASAGKSGAVSGSGGAIQSAPASHFTLQLSSASRSDTLNAFAKQQKLSNYSVYQTTRNGKTWFVLVSGVYASSGEAKRAIASLPADVQAKKPWVRSVRQVQQDQKK
ncbi:TPA: SPOR domain-containing protein [Serratia rubidaea]|uniref:SPOR domain-containing protein n=1 Tax=Serratia rubidaea TaxID=61652 RepID=UPI0023B0C93D|nr:SPOR domain-containing protein [Serratia rubidaea]MDK1706221.1 SPOR domain-containing protein [Serratia rubidaea]HDJ1440976.1 SPOR domain-containing protein [Serratia rubidaea]HDJ1449498.1 SPOR domain-containing protein [Serratia rubidaea]HDJ1460050.1 SPOR domain-containing protein [Serratia rubidaea]HDJ2771162.1 SPOR domain-containing protein [Serratia rubidaea]